MRCIEAHHRSGLGIAEEPIATESKKFHDWLAVRFSDFDAAARYTAALRVNTRDGERSK